MARPRRLSGVSYTGCARYFLTFCTAERREVFRNACDAEDALLQVRSTAHKEQFALLAYCFMPDHAHLLIEGMTDDADLRRFAKRVKQQSGASYALRRRQRLWQEGYYERVLRGDEDARAIAQYILWNPVRAGLSTTPVDYPYLGSEIWSIRELMAS